VRFGSAEIYMVLEQELPEEITDAVVVGQRRPNDLDEQVVLFLQMKPGVKFTPILVKRVKDAISQSLSKRHVPKYIFETPDIPTSHIGKKVEVPVKHILCGRNVTPSPTLANPGSLDFYRKFVDIEKVAQQDMAKL
jgi:acetoacetyl-CoA synthetase